MDPVWRQIKELVESAGCQCSIWVDDVVISGDNSELLIEPVKKLINGRGLKIGWKDKLDIMRSRDRQEVTGCSLNSAIGVPKRKRIEYARKAIEKALTGKVDAIGHIGYTSYINPLQGKQLSKLVDSINASK